MITLNDQSGHISIGNLHVTPELSEIEFLFMFRQYEDTAEGYKAVDSASYYVRNLSDGEYAVGLYFKEGKISWLSFCLGRKFNFPPFEITAAEQKELKKRLELIGGEQSYKWGEVVFSVDRKGGSVSINISYKR